MVAIFTEQSAQDIAGFIPERQLHTGRELAIYVTFGTGTTGGVVVIEGAHDASFTGTWANLATVKWITANRVHHVAVTGVHTAVRVRIATTIADGTADAYAVGN